MAGASSTTSSAAARAGELRVLAVVHEKESGEDREVAKLTAVATELTARSETSRSKRGGGGDLAGRRLKTSSVKTLGGLRRGVAQWDDRGGVTEL